MRVEIMDGRVQAHGETSGSYLFCTKSGVTLRYNVQKSDQLPVTTAKHEIKNFFRCNFFGDILARNKKGEYEIFNAIKRISKNDLNMSK